MISVTMSFLKKTPNKFRYKADDEDAAVTDLYIDKAQFRGSAVPSQILVQIRDLVR